MRRAPQLMLAGSLVVCLLMSGTGPLTADVSLPKVLSSGMVLQREMRVPVWGTAEPGEDVTVEFNGQTLKATADAGGDWRVKLEPMQAGGPFEMTVSGKNTLKLGDVLVGDVWVCSGQSNMAMSINASMNAQAEVAAAHYPKIRLFRVPNKAAAEPLKDITGGQWQPCDSRTVGGFSAVGYFFGRELHKELNVPIGLIHSNWGGTPAQAWTSWKVLEADPELRKDIIEPARKLAEAYPEEKKKFDAALAQWRAEADKARAEGRNPPPQPREPYGPASSGFPSALYNGMIAPLIPHGIKGAIWYQGESDAGRSRQYQRLLPAMIRNWRTDWGQGDFAFLIVQLPNYTARLGEPGDPAWARLREAQAMTAGTVPNCALAVTIDLGEEKDLHPRNKQDVGRRLALAALGKTYGKPIVHSGPEFDSMKVEGNKVRVKFRHTGTGLTTRTSNEPNCSNRSREDYVFTLGDAPLKGFAVAGEDRKFVWAEAKIDGDTVLVWSDKVPTPVAVRYAWAANPDCNLYNKEGLPAGPFRTDDW